MGTASVLCEARPSTFATSNFASDSPVNRFHKRLEFKKPSSRALGFHLVEGLRKHLGEHVALLNHTLSGLSQGL